MEDPGNGSLGSLGTLWTVLALIGTPLIFLAALKRLSKKNPSVRMSWPFSEAHIFCSCFSQFLLSISAFSFGYWTQRLYPPAVALLFLRCIPFD